jgi:hypothetical protein
MVVGVAAPQNRVLAQHGAKRVEEGEERRRRRALHVKADEGHNRRAQ